ncbi:hypothetical protein BDY24DRAFT_379351 [Mrakia frigida]|uniref:uncharacterized protein n=1 Tax=Mrakia frigida TaxID=29902 RepID=UPI003FCBF30E
MEVKYSSSSSDETFHSSRIGRERRGREEARPSSLPPGSPRLQSLVACLNAKARTTTVAKRPLLRLTPVLYLLVLLLGDRAALGGGATSLIKPNGVGWSERRVWRKNRRGWSSRVGKKSLPGSLVRRFGGHRSEWRWSEKDGREGRREAS